MHPAVHAERARFLLANQDKPALIFDIPLLFETRGEGRCDAVVVVTAPDDARRERSEVAATDREARLIPDEEKVRRADFAYVNDGSLDDLDAFVRGVVDALAP
jgi:dephospho-CoA kinase